LKVLQLFAKPKMATLLLLGFSSGLPLYLTGQTLQAWMTTSGIDLATIGAISLFALPYSLKFFWAPLLDRYTPPFLGRRRGWMVIIQLALMVAIGAMSLRDPRTGLQLLALNAIVIAFLSATQDIVIDAYRADILETREMGAGAAMWVLGYRVALLATGSLAYILADRMPWPTVYALMATLMIVGIIAAISAREPVLRAQPPQTLRDAVVLPFSEFFKRSGARTGLAILVFIVLYKLSDYMAQNMSTPFLLQTGFSQTEIGAIRGGIGLGATIVGVMAGGALVGKLGINRSLWVFGALQALSNLMYYLLSITQQDRGLLIATMVIENFCTGLVTSGFLAFLMSLCNVQYSATQFALLSSLMSASRDVVVSPSGAIAEVTGWPMFFIITLLAGIPGLALLPIFAPWNADRPKGAAVHTGDAAVA
jgi:MFS transporter, PAT family, beta-lactamase induction signal transducer AmpG